MVEEKWVVGDAAPGWGVVRGRREAELDGERRRLMEDAALL